MQAAKGWKDQSISTVGGINVIKLLSVWAVLDFQHTQRPATEWQMEEDAELAA